MLLGYGTASIFQKESELRDAILIKIGLVFIVTFFVIRATDFYGDPNPRKVQEVGIIATFLIL